MTFIEQARKVSNMVAAALQQSIPVGEARYLPMDDALSQLYADFVNTVPFADTEVLE